MLRFLLFLLCGGTLLLPAGHAQTTVSGRVLDAKSGKGIPGVTIWCIAHDTGTSTNPDGAFILSLQKNPSPDSISLTVSSVGYIPQRYCVTRSNNFTIQLVPQKQAIDCPIIGRAPLVELGLASGLRYAPFGGTLKLYGSRLTQRLAIQATVGYQTDFSQNHAFTATLALPPLWRRRYDVCSYYVSETLSYEELRVGVANFRFESYKAIVGIGSFRPLGNLPHQPYTTFLVGGGYAHSQPFILTDAHTTAGFGYSLGMESVFNNKQYRQLAGMVQATRWSSFWQWQARVTRSFSTNFKAGLGLNHLQRYTESTIFLNYTFH